MAAGCSRGPWDQSEDQYQIRDQTMCLVPSPKPGPLTAVPTRPLFVGNSAADGTNTEELMCWGTPSNETLLFGPANNRFAATTGPAGPLLGDLDWIVQDVVKSYNDRLKPAVYLDPNWVRAMILGAEAQDARSAARKYDPMQVANRGDPALKVLQDGAEGTNAITTPELRQKLKSKKQTPRHKGQWDYSSLTESERMDARASIEAGVAWLFRLCHEMKEEGEVLESRKLHAGDTLEGLAKELGTTLDSLKTQSGLTSTQLLLHPGQVLSYQKARVIYGPSAQAWADAIKKYNWGKTKFSGRGDPKYFDKVSKKYQELRAK